MKILVILDTIKMFINIVNSYMPMEFDELLITTGVDALVRLVKEKQRVDLEEASSVLNIPTETIEDWARVLEEEGILRIEYRLTKIFLLWVRPTEEELAGEKKSFYEEKANIVGEIGQVQGKVVTDTAGMEDLQKSFIEFYSKASTKMDALEKKVASLPAAKTISDDMLAKYGSELQDMEAKISEASESLASIKSEVDSLGLSGPKGPSQGILERLEKMNAELLAYDKEMEGIRKRAGRESEEAEDVQMPSIREIKKKFETVQKDFTSLRTRNAQLRQDMLSMHESSEILKSVAESIMGQEDKISAMRQEMIELTADADRLGEKTKGIVSQVRQNADLMERLGDSVDVAKSILKKFPSQDSVMSELEKLRAEEDAAIEKTRSLEKVLEAAGGKQVTAKQFSEVVRKMDDRMLQIRKDMDSLETSLEDEKSTYLTFQKIKERIVPTIEGYQQTLSTLQTRIDKIRADSAAQMHTITTEAQKLQQSLKTGDVQEAVKLAEEIHEKKKTLDEIKGSLDDLSTLSENIHKRITLLSREANLLEIRAGGGAPSAGESPGGGGQAQKEARTQIGLSQTEEMEFRQKREELKKLIQRLWEQ
jgi:archaellum component FlaC